MLLRYDLFDTLFVLFNFLLIDLAVDLYYLAATKNFIQLIQDFIVYPPGLS
jgi:hypothetical protein